MQKLIFLLLISSFLCRPALAGETYLARIDTAAKAMVVAAHPLAVQIGNEMLQRGGNAVDAAVAMAFVIGVVEPHASGLGGGGAMLIYLKEKNTFRYIDYYMRTGQYADTAYTDKSDLFTARSVCVPGTPAGLLLAAGKYGRLPLKEILAPAIMIARKGFIVSDKFYTSILDKLDVITLFPATQNIFFKHDFPVAAGDTLVLDSLATVLENLSEAGTDYFYNGQFARRASAAIRAAGGYLTFEDFESYQALERKPVTIRYRGYDLYSAPPPQSGVTLLEILNIFEQYPLSTDSRFLTNTTATHVLCEAIKRADVDRYYYLADPEYFRIPVSGLLDEQYARQRYADIDTAQIRYTDNRAIPAGDPRAFERDLPGNGPRQLPEDGPHTTHISVVDDQGNAVSLTQTLGLFFGSGFSSQGVVFNSAMSVFYTKPSPNRIGSSRRPLTTISPTMVFRNDSLQMVIGTPGGGRLFNVLAQVIIRLLDFGLPPEQAVGAPRFSVRISSTKLRMEPGFSVETIRQLKEKNYQTEIYPDLTNYFGGVQLIVYDRRLKSYIGVSDSRRDGAAAGYE